MCVTLQANNSQIIYKNTIKTQNSSSDIITRQDQVSIDFSCVHTQPDIKTMAFRIRDRCVVAASFGLHQFTVRSVM